MSMSKAAPINLTVWERDEWKFVGEEMVTKEEEPKIYSKEARGRQRRRWRSGGSAQNSNYPGKAICPDIFQWSPQTICLKIPNAVVVQRSADGETRVRAL